MPVMAGRPCRDRTCSNIVSNGKDCPDHKGQQGKLDYAQRGSRASRGYLPESQWQKKRRFILARDPICKLCNNGFSDTVDHRHPLERGGTNDDANLQGLDKRCHSIKTNVERTMSDTDQVMLRARKLCMEAYGRRPVGDGG